MGKGDGRRPTQVSDESFTASWCASVGHKMRSDSDWCINCGKSAQEIFEEQSSCQHLRQVTPEGRHTTFRCLDCGFVGEVQHG